MKSPIEFFITAIIVINEHLRWSNHSYDEENIMTDGILPIF